MIPEDFRLESYDYELPEELVAQFPSPAREESRLLVLDRRTGEIRHHQRFREIEDYFRPGDILVGNDSRVFPARLLGRKETGGQVEVLLLRLPQEGEPVPALFRGKRPRPGLKISFAEGLSGEIVRVLEGGKVEILLRASQDLLSLIERVGRVPLPPYIKRAPVNEDLFRYQTVYARKTGSVAAPTAGFHFTRELLERLQEKGVSFLTITLHVGYGTFAPVKCADIRQHQLHEEYVEIDPGTARKINETRQRGGAVFAVGTTTLRALEFAALKTGRVEPVSAWCDLYIYPGFRFQVVDHLVTNFHLPRSSLLILVSAFAGRELILKAYREAVARRYRFFSYGDAMLIL
ncbi:MAG: tRNA preQ1(34) S-adenosylmethionine ribosyltransferase-isomerase QueA [Thermodesulfobacteria bacterium]|nr:tRNA preQ1(34) S-adenosylmethionine ribosyltransferase-isomerase QueA [Thermodesulfobacteriota bacterium]